MEGQALNSMLERMAAGADPKTLLSEMVSQMGEDNPQAQLISRYLASRQTAQTVEEKEEESPSPRWNADPVIDIAAEVTSSRENQLRALKQIRNLAERMYSELEILRARNDLLAEAFGACHLCWGEDSECGQCRGRGMPGFQLPNRALFNEFVLPAARQLKLFRSPAAEKVPATTEINQRKE